MRVDELSALLGVSAVTIRSDLNYLEEQGLVLRSFGKAIAADRLAHQLAPVPVHSASHLSKATAAAMLRTVAASIEIDGPVLIGPGALPRQMIPLLSDIRDMRLVLADVEAILLARHCVDCEINLLAGRVAADGTSLVGAKAIQSLAFELIDLHLMQVRAVSSDGGLVVDGNEDFHGAACHHARRTVALAASSALSLEVAETRLGFGLIDMIAFASPPDTGCRRLLADAGFEQDRAGAEAPLYRRSQP